MSFAQSFASGSVEAFTQRVLHRLMALATETGQRDFRLPIGMFLLVDEAHGGDAVAKELASRFRLLDFESCNVIDFYFLGWSFTNDRDAPLIRFDLEVFEVFRRVLKDAGVSHFGGNADLILVDAHYVPGQVTLDFSQAIRVDLSASQSNKDFPTLGHFLQKLIEAAESLRSDHGSAASPVLAISDKLGLAIAKESLLAFLLEKWGALIGAHKMATVAVRSLGPPVSLKEFRTS